MNNYVFKNVIFYNFDLKIGTLTFELYFENIENKI